MTASANPAYVALGDSISIDDYAGGAGRGGASLLFANRDADFPEWRGRDLKSIDPGTTFTLLATDGATTRTLLQTQLPRLAALASPPTVVTLTIRGAVAGPRTPSGGPVARGAPTCRAGPLVLRRNRAEREGSGRRAGGVLGRAPRK